MKPTPSTYRVLWEIGLCHNAQLGTYGHECGRPATWLATKASGWQSGFCNRCKEHGDERHGFVRWQRIADSSVNRAEELLLMLVA
jgi:hypothetical protein